MASNREERVQQALGALHDGETTSIRAAARAYNLTELTLRRRYHNTCITRQIAQESRQLLTPAQEDLTVTWIL